MKGHSTYILALLLAFSCQVNRQYSSKPAKSLNNPDSESLEVNAVAYHTNDSVTVTYLEVRNENLLYKRPDTTTAFYAELRVNYILTNDQNSRKIIDSGSFYMRDRAENENMEIKSLFSKFSLPARLNSTYNLVIEAFDVNRKTKYSKTVGLNKLNNFSDQNFLVSRRDSVAFKNHFLKNDAVAVKFASASIKRLTVDCFLSQSGPALPPFSIRTPDEVKYKPDSSFMLNVTSKSFTLTMPERGFYHVRADPNSNEGLTLYTFDRTFPGVSNSEEMINCSRYIMSRDEFEECKEAPDKKAAIDKFWLGIGASNERARGLLKRYYGRVKEANKHYSSFVEGWKTDRGMIFIIFGPPANIYRSKKDEIWVYGNEANPAALRFVFNKTKNPFSENEYVMERSQFYKEPWHTAVDYWRQGNIYMETKR